MTLDRLIHQHSSAKDVDYESIKDARVLVNIPELKQAILSWFKEQLPKEMPVNPKNYGGLFQDGWNAYRQSILTNLEGEA